MSGETKKSCSGSSVDVDVDGEEKRIEDVWEACPAPEAVTSCSQPVGAD